MEARQQQDRIDRQIAHMDAVRRLRAGVRQHPDARGLEKALRFHMTSVGALAADFCDR